MTIRKMRIAFLLVMTFTPAASAAKPTVLISEMVSRATHIVVGRVISQALKDPAQKSGSGEWLPEKRLVRVQTKRVLKMEGSTQIPQEFVFEVKALLFEESASYILFLKAFTPNLSDKTAETFSVRFEYLGSPARRVEATDASLLEVQKEIEKTNPLSGRGEPGDQRGMAAR